MSNHYFNKIKNYFQDANYRFIINDGLGLYRFMNDKEYLERKFYVKLGYKLDLSNPKTYNEKLQWLKLFDHRKAYTMMVDKYAVKQFVANTIGAEYVIPTISVWDKPEDIDFSTLPNQFVLKVTHDSGGLVICKDKKKLDIDKTRKKLKNSLARDYYLIHREWPYKNVRRRIICEYYMEDKKTAELRDYKFFCFDGVPKALYIAQDRQKAEETKFDFFDMEFNHLPFINGHPNADTLPQPPVSFELMKELAKKLSKGIPHVRVDFYEVNGKVYFGELTFAHMSGFASFEPFEWDEIFGSWINLPSKSI